MKPKNLYKNILVILGLVSVGLFVSYYFVYQDIKNKNESISLMSQQMDLESSRQEYLVTTQRMIKDISVDIERINNSIVSKGGDVQFIESLEAVAKNNGLTINIDSIVIEEDKSISTGDITTLRIKAKTKGGWVGTYTFLRQIESLPYKIKINQFGMQGSINETELGKKTTTSEWNSVFEIRVLKYK